MKTIPAPVDVVGRLVSFRPSHASDILLGEVVDVRYESGADPRYPKGSQGYDNGIRKLFPKITVMLPDDRAINMSCDKEGIEKYRIIAENQNEDHW